MSKAELKKLLNERWNELYPNKRLSAIQLNGFTHTVFYDEQGRGTAVDKNNISRLHFSNCMRDSEAKLYGMNDDNLYKLFEGIPNYQYQNNAVELVYVMP